MSGADQPAVLPSEREQLAGLGRALDERLFDVHVRPRKQRLAGRGEVHARGRADVHDIGVGVSQEVRERAERSGSRQLGEPARGRLRGIAHRRDDMRRGHASKGMDMEPGHPPGADDRYAEGAARVGWCGHADGSLQDRRQSRVAIRGPPVLRARDMKRVDLPHGARARFCQDKFAHP